MKSNKLIAIHHRKSSFSERWIQLAERESLPYKVVDCTSNQFLYSINDYSALLWHIGTSIPAESIVADGILSTMESAGLPVFPNHSTRFHFDNKLAQAFLLEKYCFPAVQSYIFFDLPSALHWVNTSEFPKVFKLKGGSGSRNVFLVKSRRDAIKLCKKAFGAGFSQVGTLAPTSVNLHKLAKAANSKSLFNLIASIPAKYKLRERSNSYIGREAGYVYFQDFIPNCSHDTRVTVVDDKAFAFRRSVRPGDFRASGSGMIDFRREYIDTSCIQIAFDLAYALQSQSLAIDFIHSRSGKPMIVEMSLGYDPNPIYNSGGHWNSSLDYYQIPIWPQDLIMKSVLKNLI